MAHATRVDGRRRRESLMDAALSCFNEQGILATGIEQIRQRAGASPSSVYHHFAGLDDLSAALLIRTFERVISHITASVKGTDNAGDAIRVLVRSYLEWVFEHREEARFMYQATTVEISGTHRQDVMEAKSRLYEPLSAHLHQFIAMGDLPGWQWAQLTAVVLGPSRDACRHLLAGGDVHQDWMLAALPGIAWQSLQEA